MNRRLRLISRIAIFSALVYVLSWGTSYLPNVNPVFFVVFAAGFLWGLFPGIAVGLIGMGLWTNFHPFGPALPPIMVAQITGAAGSGLVGAWYARTDWETRAGFRLGLELVICSVVCTLLFYIPVNVIDAWLFQPFWPRFWVSWMWTPISLISNALIFPLLFGAVRILYAKEQGVIK